MYVKNKRKAVKYSGKLCVLSLITVTSLCVVGGKDAKASLRSRVSGIASQVANLFRGIGDGINNGVMNLRSRTSSTTTGSITGNNQGLQVKQTVGDGKVTITVSLVDENGTQKVFPKQPTSAMEKLLWKPGDYSEQRYVGSDGKTKRFAFKISGTSGSGTSSRTSSSGSSSSTSTTSVSLSSRGSSSITTSVGTRNNQDGVDGSGGIGSGASSGTKAYVSRLNLLMTKDGDKIKFVEQSKVAFNGKVTQQGKGMADKLKVQSSSTSSKLTPITTISGGPSTSSGSGTTTTVTTTTATGTSGTTTTSSTGTKTSTTTSPGGTSSSTSTLSNVKLSSPQTTSTSTRGVTKLTTTSTTGTGTSSSSSTTSTGTTTSSSSGSNTTVTTSTKTTPTPTVTGSSSSATPGIVTVKLKTPNGDTKEVTAQTHNPDTRATKTAPPTGLDPDDSNPGVQKALEESLKNSTKSSTTTTTTTTLTGPKLSLPQTSSSSSRTVTKIGGSSSSSSSSPSTGGSSSDVRDYQKEGVKPKSRDNKEFDTLDDGRYRPSLATIPEGDESGSASSSRRSSLGSTGSDDVDYSAMFDDKEVQKVLSKYSKYAK